MLKNFSIVPVLLLVLPLAGVAQLRSGLSGSGVQEVNRTTVRANIYEPGLNVRRVGAFSGLVKEYRMQHSFEMTMASVGGATAAQNIYTNSNLFQFTNTLSARVDVGVAMTPFSNLQGMPGMNQPAVFIRNASIDYRPNGRVSFHMSFSQDPFLNNVFRQPGMNRFNTIGGF